MRVYSTGNMFICRFAVSWLATRVDDLLRLPISTPVLLAAFVPTEDGAMASQNLGATSGTTRRRRITSSRPATSLGSAISIQDDLSSTRSPAGSKRSWALRNAVMISFLGLAAAGYFSSLALLLFNQRAQNAIIFLHWLRPPAFLRIAPLDNLMPWRLASSARVVVADSGIRGWHILPPGPPYPPVEPSLRAPRFAAPTCSSEREQFFDAALAAPAGARVVIFFHGNSGTRGFPFKRVDMLRLLGAHLGAHVVTFDYSGFGDSPGLPSEAQLYRDARAAFDWVAARVNPTSAHIILYGQSLGTFAATHLASTLLPRQLDEADLASGNDDVLARVHSPSLEVTSLLRALVLDAPPASVVDAAMTHPSCRIFRFIPRLRDIAAWALRNCALDNVRRAGEIDERLPILILHGECDSFIPIEQGRKVFEAARARGNPDVRLVEFPGVGHVNVNAAHNFLSVLTEFVDEQLSSVPSGFATA